MALSKKTLDGNVETFLLSILSEGKSYGYEIVRSLNAKSPNLVSFGEGTVYPVLHRMEKKGLLTAEWQEGDTGRKRKYYRITTKGKKALGENLAEWQLLNEAMAAITGHQTASI